MQFTDIWMVLPKTVEKFHCCGLSVLKLEEFLIVNNLDKIGIKVV